MIEAELLLDVAARRLSSRKLDRARRAIEGRASRLYWRIFWIDMIRALVSALGFFTLLIGLLVAYFSPHSREWLAPLFSGCGAAALMAGVYSGRLIQRRKRFFVQRAYDTKIPAKVEGLLNDLATGRLRAMLLMEYGQVGTNALRTADGKYFDRELAPGTFTNRFAPILLLSDSAKFSSLWMPGWRTLNRPIYVVQENAGGLQQEPDEAQPLPATPVHWIAKIPSDRFSAWQSDVLQRGNWDVLTQIQIGQVLDNARKQAEGDQLAGRKFNVSRFAKVAHKTSGLSSETIRKLIALSGDSSDYTWVRTSAEAASIGSNMVGCLTEKYSKSIS